MSRNRRLRTPWVVLGVAHLDDEERALVLGMVLEEALSRVRSLSGSSSLRALVALDEVFGFLPPPSPATHRAATPPCSPAAQRTTPTRSTTS